MKAAAKLIELRKKIINNIGEVDYANRIPPYITIIKQVMVANDIDATKALQKIKDSSLCQIKADDLEEIKIQKGIKLEMFSCAMLELLTPNQ